MRWSSPGHPRSTHWSSASGPGSSTPTAASTGPALAAIAFADDEGRKALGEITWPAIGEEFERRIKAAPARHAWWCATCRCWSRARRRRPAPYVAVIVVEAPIDVRLARLEIRGVPRDDAERRMAAQATDDERRAVATHLVDNGGDLDAARRPGRHDLGGPPHPRAAGARRGQAAGLRSGITVVPRR